MKLKIPNIVLIVVLCGIISKKYAVGAYKASDLWHGNLLNKLYDTIYIDKNELSHYYNKDGSECETDD